MRKRILSQKATFFSWFILILITGCMSQENPDQGLTGVTYISPLGSPPADSIAWSPTDESKILVTSGDVGQGRAEVYVMDIQTGKKTTIAKTKYGDFVEATWSPDGKNVLLLVRDGTIGYKPDGLWILNSDTGSTVYFVDAGCASWSPDGNMIAAFSASYVNTDSEIINIQLIEIDTKREESIFSTNEAEYFWGLSWSSDGNRIVFGLGQDSPGDIYTLSLDTHRVTQITKNKSGSAPTWSPKGNIIAYVDWPPKGTQTTLHLISPDGVCDIEIPNLKYVWSPTWSPDGKKLGYISNDGLYYLELEKIIGRDIYHNLCQ